jgi:hypothetical protein
MMPAQYAQSLVVVAVLLISPADGRAGETVLPGTQPQEGGIEFAKVQQCLMCHSKTPNGQADPYFSWWSGMMAQSARDPVFRAALAIADQDVEGVCAVMRRADGWKADPHQPTPRR